MEVADVRRRLRGALEKARNEAAERRVLHDAAARDYADFLERVAVPVFHQLAAALVAEGHLFKVSTPAGSVRIASERSPNEAFVELSLDDTLDVPQVVGHATWGRGRRMVSSERPLQEGLPIAALGDDHVLSYLIDAIVPLLGVRS